MNSESKANATLVILLQARILQEHFLQETQRKHTPTFYVMLPHCIRQSDITPLLLSLTCKCIILKQDIPYFGKISSPFMLCLTVVVTIPHSVQKKLLNLSKDAH